MAAVNVGVVDAVGRTWRSAVATEIKNVVESDDGEIEDLLDMVSSPDVANVEGGSITESPHIAMEISGEEDTGDNRVCIVDNVAEN